MIRLLLSFWRHATAPAVAILIVAPAVAEPWDCTFTTSCRAGLNCIPVDFPAEVIAADHEGQLFLNFDGYALIATRLTGDRSYSAYSIDRRVHLSIMIDATAWLSQHEFFAETLFGSCQRTQS